MKAKELAPLAPVEVPHTSDGPLGLKPVADCLTRLRTQLPTLQGTGEIVGQYVLDDPWRARGMTIHDLASTAGVSENSVSRFARAIGYSGFREFMSDLALALGRQTQTAYTFPSEAVDQPGGESVVSIVRGVIRVELQSIHDMVACLDWVQVERVVEALCDAKHVLTVSMWTTASISSLLTSRLGLIGLRASTSIDPYALHIGVGNLAPGDVAFGISLSGQSRMIVELLRFARERGATVVAMTAIAGSPITAVADLSLSVVGATSTISPGGQKFGGRLAALVLVEALAAAVAWRKFDGNPPTVELIRSRYLATLG